MYIGVIVSLIFFMLFFISIIHHKKWYSPDCIFVLFWSVISLGSLFYKYFGVKPVSFKTWIVVLVGVISFWVGCNSRSSLRKKIGHHGSNNVNNENRINIVYYYVLFIICLPFLVSILIRAFTMVRNGMSLLYIRASYYGLNGLEQYWTSTGWASLFEKYLTGPLKMMVAPITITFCLKRRVDYKLIIIAVFIILTDVLTSGGRFILLYVLIQAIAGILITRGKIKISRKTKQIVRIIAAAAVVGIAYLTVERNVGYSMWQGVFEYLCCCIPLLNHYIPKIPSFTYGTASLFGFINPVLTITNRIVPITTPYEKVLSSTLNIQNAVELSPTITSNAFVTSFFYTYLDFGWLGLAVGMFLFGSWAKNADTNLRNNVTERNLAIYLLMVQGIIKSIQHMPFSNTSYVLAILYIILLTKEKSMRGIYEYYSRYS